MQVFPSISTLYFFLSDFCCFVEISVTLGIRGVEKLPETFANLSLTKELLRGCGTEGKHGNLLERKATRILFSLIASELRPTKVYGKQKRRARDRAWALGNPYGLERQNLTYSRRCRLCEFACLPLQSQTPTNGFSYSTTNPSVSYFLSIMEGIATVTRMLVARMSP